MENSNHFEDVSLIKKEHVDFQLPAMLVFGDVPTTWLSLDEAFSLDSVGLDFPPVETLKPHLYTLPETNIFAPEN